MDLQTRMTNCFTEVCVVSYILFILEPRELKQAISKAPAAHGICPLRRLPCMFFACARPPPQKNRRTDRAKKTKTTFYIAKGRREKKSDVSK
jgi:hypothetical protein